MKIGQKNSHFFIKAILIYGVYETGFIYPVDEIVALNHKKDNYMALKPGPKPIADSTGKPDRRRRDNKDTPGNTPGLKPSKSSKK